MFPLKEKIVKRIVAEDFRNVATFMEDAGINEEKLRCYLLLESLCYQINFSNYLNWQTTFFLVFFFSFVICLFVVG